MKFSQCLGLFLATCVTAAPAAELEPRAKKVTDIDILNFALTLEHLEDAFYKEGISKFGQKAFDKAGFVPRVRTNIKEISSDESTHVKFLTSVIKELKYTPVKACEYSFGLKTVEDFIALAQVLEGVGVSAYLGAAALISDKAYLTPAGSILTVEARHNAYIRDNEPKHPQSPFPAPFDVPLSLNEVYTLASAFITKCPKDNPALPVKAFPAMALATGEKPIHRLGSTVKLDVAKKLNEKKTYHAAFITVTGPIFTKTEVLKGGKSIKIDVPKSALLPGQAYVVLSTSNKEVTDGNTVAGPAIVPIMPTYAIGGFPM